MDEYFSSYKSILYWFCEEENERQNKEVPYQRNQMIKQGEDVCLRKKSLI